MLYVDVNTVLPYMCLLSTMCLFMYDEWVIVIVIIYIYIEYILGSVFLSQEKMCDNGNNGQYIE